MYANSPISQLGNVCLMHFRKQGIWRVVVVPFGIISLSNLSSLNRPCVFTVCPEIRSCSVLYSICRRLISSVMHRSKVQKYDVRWHFKMYLGPWIITQEGIIFIVTRQTGNSKYVELKKFNLKNLQGHVQTYRSRGPCANYDCATL